MHDKWHCLEAVYYTQHKRCSHKGNVFNRIGGINRNISKMIHVQQKFQWAQKVWKRCIFIGRIIQIYECRLRIHMVGKNFLLDLHKMPTTLKIDVANSNVKIIFWKLFEGFSTMILNLLAFTFHSKPKSPMTELDK
jgi:hypothetical protein